MGDGELDGPRLQHRGSRRGEVQHLRPADGGQLARPRHDARVGREDPVDVGEDLALAQAERRGQGHRRRVGTAAAQRGDVPAGRDPLEAGDEHDRPGVQLLEDAQRAGSRGAGRCRAGRR